MIEPSTTGVATMRHKEISDLPMAIEKLLREHGLVLHSPVIVSLTGPIKQEKSITEGASVAMVRDCTPISVSVEAVGEIEGPWHY